MPNARDPNAEDPFAPVAAGFDQLDSLSRRFGQSLSQSLARGIVEGRNLGDVLRGVGDQLMRLSLRQAESGLAGGINALLGSGISGLGSLLAPGSGLAEGWAAAPPAGIRAAAPEPRGGPVINMQVHAQDAESFLRAESQVTAALARAVARGQRAL